MNKFLLCFFGLLSANYLLAQYNVVFQLEKTPSYHTANNQVFMAGNFNNWNPADKNYQLKELAGKGYSLTLPLNKGRYEYKLTRGGWDKSECKINGASIDNKVLNIFSDTVINLEVEGWADHFQALPKTSTANSHVKIIDTAFFIPQLKRTRRVWIYLPASYTSSKNKYPVLYMHDGQNVFDNLTSYAGEWGVDEALDSLEKSTKEIIVVAMDHGGEKRINEYAPYHMEKYGNGEGDLYVDFLVHTLKPFIDKYYRTCKKKINFYCW